MNIPLEGRRIRAQTFHSSMTQHALKQLIKLPYILACWVGGVAQQSCISSDELYNGPG